MPFTCQHPLPTAPIMDITPLSIITRDGGLQRLDITATLARPPHAPEWPTESSSSPPTGWGPWGGREREG